MEKQVEYHDAMIRMLELVWGAGYMAPGGPAKVDDLVSGLDLRGQADADHFIEDWRSMVVVFERGHLTQTICRSFKPA